MSDSSPDRLISDLRSAGIEIGPGLSAPERAEIEEALGLLLPPDLAELLEAGVPRGDRFPDWHGGAGSVGPMVAAPVEGLLFDVEHNCLWLEDWGQRPPGTEEARQQARAELKNVPPLVPVWGHRYLPTSPHASGNPVLSAVQSDIIVYGSDLADYFAREFHLLHRTDTEAPEVRSVPFWGQFIG